MMPNLPKHTHTLLSLAVPNQKFRLHFLGRFVFIMEKICTEERFHTAVIILGLYVAEVRNVCLYFGV